MCDDEIMHNLKRAIIAALQIAENSDLSPRERLKALGMGYALLQWLRKYQRLIDRKQKPGAKIPMAGT